jgi:cytochrome c5
MLGSVATITHPYCRLGQPWVYSTISYLYRMGSPTRREWKLAAQNDPPSFSCREDTELFERTWSCVCCPTPVLGSRASAWLIVSLALAVMSCPAAAATPDGAAKFHKTVKPILTEYCANCHNSNLKKGGIAFDPDDAKPLLADKTLWLKVFKMLRAEMMPPRGKSHPSAEQVERVVSWIKYSAFAIDPKDPDPGRVTLRRLNRTEYRNTIRDLMGVDFNATGEFPADDTGYGFDTIGDVLTLSPLLLEKYIAAAKVIVAQAVQPANYKRFFPGPIPDTQTERRAYAFKVLEAFASRAYRRPVDRETVDRLVQLVETAAARPGRTFEAGMAQAMTVVLASPRFLFREEETLPNSTDRYPLLDEYALASRLSYFLWSSMPDEELLRLAAQNKLRQNLSVQVSRMLADKRSSEFIRNFAGQWLQSRSIDSVNVNPFAVLSREQPRDPKAEEARLRFRTLVRKPREELTEAEKKELDQLRSTFFSRFRRFRQFALTGDLRRAMRQETEMSFAYVVQNDRSLLELLDANYTFLNERLAKYYEIEGVSGEQMRKVNLPTGSPRGGILTQATFLLITSNPDRTSPVKRGLFILDNILGTPPPPPPPDIAPLEQAAEKVKGKPPTLREMLVVHRSKALCNSCHNRMDPLGLAFENFNALGRWRDKELNQPIEASGQLLTGESFQNVQELKRILTTSRRLDFYRCAAEKMLIYALGRGLEPYDMHTVDELVAKLEAAQGRPSVLIRGILSSPAFQRRRDLSFRAKR